MRSSSTIATDRIERAVEEESSLCVRTPTSPQLPPPLRLLVRRRERGDVHLLPHVFDGPTGEVRDVDRFALLPVAQVAAVVPRGGTVTRPGPRMVEDVAGLEVAAVAGLLEHQILGEVRAVVAAVQAGREGGLRAARVGCFAGQPEDAELFQLLA